MVFQHLLNIDLHHICNSRLIPTIKTQDNLNNLVANLVMVQTHQSQEMDKCPWMEIIKLNQDYSNNAANFSKSIQVLLLHSTNSNSSFRLNTWCPLCIRMSTKVLTLNSIRYPAQEMVDHLSNLLSHHISLMPLKGAITIIQRTEDMAV